MAGFSVVTLDSETAESIQRALVEGCAGFTKHDTVLVYFVGHCFQDEEGAFGLSSQVEGGTGKWYFEQSAATLFEAGIKQVFWLMDDVRGNESQDALTSLSMRPWSILPRLRELTLEDHRMSIVGAATIHKNGTERFALSHCLGRAFLHAFARTDKTVKLFQKIKSKLLSKSWGSVESWVRISSRDGEAEKATRF